MSRPFAACIRRRLPLHLHREGASRRLVRCCYFSRCACRHLAHPLLRGPHPFLLSPDAFPYPEPSAAARQSMRHTTQSIRRTPPPQPPARSQQLSCSYGAASSHSPLSLANRAEYTSHATVAATTNTTTTTSSACVIRPPSRRGLHQCSWWCSRAWCSASVPAAIPSSVP